MRSIRLARGRSAIGPPLVVALIAGCANLDGGVNPRHVVLTVPIEGRAHDVQLFVLGEVLLRSKPLHWDHVLRPGDVIETSEGQRFTADEVYAGIASSPGHTYFSLTRDGQVVPGSIPFCDTHRFRSKR